MTDIKTIQKVDLRGTFMDWLEQDDGTLAEGEELATAVRIAIGTYALLLAWNEYLYAYLLLSHERTIPLAVALGHFIAADDSPWELLMATGLVYALPPAASARAALKTPSVFQ